MDFISGLVVFILLWWWVFFMSLPFGIKMPDVVGNGHATSAPEKPLLWRKVIISTAIASMLFIIIYWIIDSGYISFSEI